MEKKGILLELSELYRLGRRFAMGKFGRSSACGSTLADRTKVAVDGVSGGGEEMVVEQIGQVGKSGDVVSKVGGLERETGKIGDIGGVMEIADVLGEMVGDKSEMVMGETGETE